MGAERAAAYIWMVKNVVGRIDQLNTAQLAEIHDGCRIFMRS
jgi:hypothetical protein